MNPNIDLKKIIPNDHKLKLEALYKEYDSIREKMRPLEIQKLGIVVFTFGAWIAGLSLYEKANFPTYLIPIIIYGILILGSSFFYSNRYHYIRCFTYILVFIESEIPYLNWESVADKFLSNEIQATDKNNFDFLLDKLVQPNLFWINLIFYSNLAISIREISSMFKRYNGEIVIIYILLLFLFNILAIKYIKKFLNLNSKEIVGRWQNIYNDIYKDDTQL